MSEKREMFGIQICCWNIPFLEADGMSTVVNFHGPGSTDRNQEHSFKFIVGLNKFENYHRNFVNIYWPCSIQPYNCEHTSCIDSAVTSVAYVAEACLSWSAVTSFFAIFFFTIQCLLSVSHIHKVNKSQEQINKLN